MNPAGWRAAARVAVIYMLIAGVWILFSDKALAALTNDPYWLTQLAIYKGWGFVCVTGMLLFVERYRAELRQLRLIAAEHAALEQVRGQEAAVRREHDLVQRITQTSPVGITVINSAGQITFANPRAEQMLGLSRADVAQHSYNAPDWHITDYAGQPFPENDLPFTRVKATGQIVENLPLAIQWPDGHRILLSTNAAPLLDADGRWEGLVTAITDTTRAVETEAQLRKLNRALRLVNECNQALIHAASEPQLLETLCGLMVEHGHYRLVWVGLAEDDEGRAVRPVAYAGYEAGYLENAHISWGDNERGHGPTGIAIRENRTVVNADFATSPHMAPWRAAALERGYGSSVALPLSLGKHAMGAFTLYAPQPHAFDQDEVKLLEELIADLAYGLQTLRLREAREQAERLIRIQADQLQAQNKALLAQNEELAAQGRALAQAEASLQRQNAYLKALHETTLDLIAMRALDPLLQNIVTRAEQLMDTTAGYLDLIEPETGRLVPRIGTGALAESLHHIVRPGEGAVGIVWQTGQPLVIDDYDAWSGRVQTVRPGTIGAIAAVPLLSQAEVVGILGLAYEASDRRRFDPEALEVLTQFARLAVIAIDNSRLFAQAQHELAERRQAEAALRESQAILAAAERVAHIGSWRWDLHTLKVAWSDEMFRLFSFDRAEFNGDVEQIFRARVHPEDLPALQNATARMLQEQEPWPIEYRLNLPDGTERVVWTESRLNYDEAGQRASLTGYVQDITERKQVETQLRQLNTELEQRVAARTAELRQANEDLARIVRGKDDFLASMSHELRTPLTGILGMTETLELGTYGTLSEPQFQAVHVVRESGLHLLSLINDILDLARVEAGKMLLELGPVSIPEICQASLRLVHGQASPKRIKIETRQDAFVTRLWADERRLKQMLVNLLSNAIKFTPPDGQIGLEVAGDAVREEIHFAVWDTGIGISAENIARLFQPFVQVETALTRASGGSGLGLALVRRMAELHGGRVAVESEGVPGKGSRFTIVLPWKPANQMTTAEAFEGESISTPALPAAQGKLVLIADDVETIREVLNAFLTPLGCRVAQARDGVEAWKLFRDLKPDLSLVDIQMPGLDGLEVIRRVRADPELVNTPLIAMTALAMPGDRERCLAAGANEYLSKPINRAQLVTVVSRMLRREALPPVRV